MGSFRQLRCFLRDVEDIWGVWLEDHQVVEPPGLLAALVEGIYEQALVVFGGTFDEEADLKSRGFFPKVEIGKWVGFSCHRRIAPMPRPRTSVEPRPFQSQACTPTQGALGSL